MWSENEFLKALSACGPAVALAAIVRVGLFRESNPRAALISTVFAVALGSLSGWIAIGFLGKSYAVLATATMTVFGEAVLRGILKLLDDWQKDPLKLANRLRRLGGNPPAPPEGEDK